MRVYSALVLYNNGVAKPVTNFALSRLEGRLIVSLPAVTIISGTAAWPARDLPVAARGTGYSQRHHTEQ